MEVVYSGKEETEGQTLKGGWTEVVLVSSHMKHRTGQEEMALSHARGDSSGI